MKRKNALLSSFAFEDPDHKISQHDAALHFLAQDHVIVDVLKSLDIVKTPQQYANKNVHKCKQKSCTCMHVCVFDHEQKDIVKNCTLQAYQVVTKGINQSKETIGFHDGILCCNILWKSEPHVKYLEHELTYNEFVMCCAGTDSHRACCSRFVKHWNFFQSKALFKDKIVWAKKKVFGGNNSMHILGESAPFLKKQDGAPNEWCRETEPDFILRVDENVKKVPGWMLHETTTTEITEVKRLIIETKFHKTSASNISRQINLFRAFPTTDVNYSSSYSQYFNSANYSFWCVATFFDLSELEQEELRRARIFWIRMGPRFDAWWLQQQHLLPNQRVAFFKECIQKEYKIKKQNNNMGGSSSCSSIKTGIEQQAFPARSSSYTTEHPNLVLVGKPPNVIACMRYTPATNETQKVVLYAHGNATDIGRTHAFLTKLCDDLQVDIISFDMPGYGVSNGTPSEKSCMTAIWNVYEYLLSQNVQRDQIILYGSSIGTGPCVQLAALLSLRDPSNTLHACLLQAPYRSVIGVVSPSLETTCDMSCTSQTNPNIFRSLKVIDQIECPVYILHGLKDEVIAYDHAVKLHAKMQKAHKVSHLVTIPEAGHNNIEADHFHEIVQILKTIMYSHK